MMIGQYPGYLYLIGSFLRNKKKRSKRENSGCIFSNKIIIQEMDLTWLYTALAVLVAALIFLLKNTKKVESQEEETGEQESESNNVQRRQPGGPAPVGPGGRRRNFQPRRPQRNQVRQKRDNLK